MRSHLRFAKREYLKAAIWKDRRDGGWSAAEFNPRETLIAEDHQCPRNAIASTLDSTLPILVRTHEIHIRRTKGRTRYALRDRTEYSR